MLPQNFLAGLEETIARIISLILTLTFYGLYFGSKTPVLFDWYTLIGILALFWLVYEALAYLLFVVFNFFSKNKNNSDDKSADQVKFAVDEAENQEIN
jgi:uncharacterized membrane protein